MSAFDRLQQWEAGAGAGKDAAGRLVYSGPGMQYMGPGEFSRTQAEHDKMKVAAMKSDPQGMLIRQLLDQVQNQNLPGQASVRGLVGSYNAPDMRINAQDPRQAQG
jgi:hypothetical protein